VTQFDRFIHERKYLKNVSPRTLQWYAESFKWLGTEQPSDDDLGDPPRVGNSRLTGNNSNYSAHCLRMVGFFIVRMVALA
jgi:hypothetical protein